MPHVQVAPAKGYHCSSSPVAAGSDTHLTRRERKTALGPGERVSKQPEASTQ